MAPIKAWLHSMHIDMDGRGRRVPGVRLGFIVEMPLQTAFYARQVGECLCMCMCVCIYIYICELCVSMCEFCVVMCIYVCKICVVCVFVCFIVEMPLRTAFYAPQVGE